MKRRQGGPWEVKNTETESRFSKGWKNIKAPTGYIIGLDGYLSSKEGWVHGVKIAYSDAEFIALAREALPWWINRAVELDAEVERLREALDYLEEVKNNG